MKPPLCWVLLPLWLLAVLGQVLPSAHAQATDPSKPQAPGWTSSWTDGITARQRKDRELATQYEQTVAAKKYPEALRICEQAVAEYPDLPTPRAMRAFVFLKLNRLEPAAQDIERGLRWMMQNHKPAGQALFLWLRAELRARQMQYPAAVEDLRAAVKLAPHPADALNSLAWLRATCPVSGLRNGPEAVRLARQALTSHPHQPYRVLDTLAAAYAESSDYPRAVESEQQALADARKAAPTDAAATAFLRNAPKRLQFFEQNQPYHRDTFLD